MPPTGNFQLFSDNEDDIDEVDDDDDEEDDDEDNEAANLRRQLIINRGR